MNCKRLNAELIQKEYCTRILQKKYLTHRIQKYFNVIGGETQHYTVCQSEQKFGVCYCVSYRPVGTLEWILERGWWNDRGIWTADGIFNDGIV